MRNGLVAQWTRARGYEPRCRGFESLLARFYQKLFRRQLMFFMSFNYKEGENRRWLSLRFFFTWHLTPYSFTPSDTCTLFTLFTLFTIPLSAPSFFNRLQRCTPSSLRSEGLRRVRRVRRGYTGTPFAPNTLTLFSVSRRCQAPLG